MLIELVVYIDQFIQMNDFLDYYEDSVVIIGILCEFSGVKNYDEFWENFRDGKESIMFYSKEEFQCFGILEEMVENVSYVLVKFLIDGKDKFDLSFF